MKPAPETIQAVHVERNPWFAALVVLIVSFSLIVLGLELFAPRSRLAEDWALPLLIGVIGAFLGLFKIPYARHREAKVLASKEGVQILYGGSSSGERLSLPRSELESGWLTPPAGFTTLVRLKPRGLRQSIDLEVDNARVGRRLLRALSLAISQTTETFRLSSRLNFNPWMILLAIPIVPFGMFLNFLRTECLGEESAAGFLLLIFILGLAMFIPFAMPSWLDVGVDGVLLRWFGTRRFIGYGEVASVTVFDEFVYKNTRWRGVLLSLKIGEKVRLGVSDIDIDHRIVVLEERLQFALAAYAAGGGEEDATLLRRGARPVGEWIRWLRAVGTGANADLRTAPVAPERLWRIVESPSAQPSARAAAATALGASVDEVGRSRLRAAAATTAAPKLRIALEAAAGEQLEEGAFEEALRELEAAEPTGQRSAGG